LKKSHDCFLVLYISIKLSQDPNVRVFPISAAEPFASHALRAIAAALLALAAAACDDGTKPVQVPGGDAKLGKRLIEQYQCGSCHAIPEVAAARGSAGPALEGFGRRSYIAGRIPNLPDPLAQWLVDPPAMKPGTMMPDLGVSPHDARHMAAYLYTLR
jgi:cytochrome c